jgi:hypothetical protein
VLNEFDLNQSRQSEQDLDHYVESYSRPGRMTAELSTSDLLPFLGRDEAGTELAVDAGNPASGDLPTLIDGQLL